MICKNMPSRSSRIMKKNKLFFLAFLVSVSLLFPGYSWTKDRKITVYNPRGIKPEIRKIPMASRPATVKGRTVYIVDTKYPNTKPFVEELYTALKNRYPETDWVLKEKIGSYMQDDPNLWKEIKEKASGAVILLGH